MQHPRQRGARQCRLAIRCVFHGAQTEVVKSLAQLAGFPIHPGREIATQVATRAPRLGDIGQGHVDPDIELVGLLAQLGRDRHLVYVALAGMDFGVAARDERRSMIRVCSGPRFVWNAEAQTARGG